MKNIPKNVFPPVVLELLPHMVDYAVVEERVWLPYVMGATLPNIRSTSLNTDGFGFRYTIDQNVDRFSPSLEINASCNILIGASQPFGFGATSDATTVASCFAQSNNLPWYNFSMPGFTLAQNLIHLLFFLPRLKTVEKIVLLGGVTDLNHFLRTPLYPKLFGGFFQFMQYFSKLNTDFYNKNCEIRIPAEFNELYAENMDPSNSYDNFAESIYNSLHILKFISDSLGSDLVFALQPVAKWMKRTPTREESMLLNSKPEQQISHELLAASAYNKWYRTMLGNFCSELNIKYIDLNTHFEKSTKSSLWLFIDNVHLHDNGSLLAVDIINKEFGFS